MRLKPNAFLEVEHFRWKDRYKDEVLTWTNLLPACKRCNSRKSDHDVVANPIVDPTAEEPKTHLKLRGYRFDHRTPKGKETIEALGFHLDLKLMTDRFKLGTKASNDLDELASRLPMPGTSADAKFAATIRRRFTALLERGQRTEKYAATVATVLLSESNFSSAKSFLQSTGQWNQRLIDLENELTEIALV